MSISHLALLLLFSYNIVSCRGANANFSIANFSPELFAMAESPSYDEMRKISKAQLSEDIWLFESLFYGMKEGLIIESGALDGILYSTTYFLESVANWSAIHIEADTDTYRKLAQNRPVSVNLHAALCSKPKIYHYLDKNVYFAHGILEFMSKDYLSKWCSQFVGYESNPSILEQLPKVHCIPMKKILKHLNVTHVDVWVLDVEGAEEEALLGTDFKAVRFNLIIMEMDETDLAKDKRKILLLEHAGFECIMINWNSFCKNKLFTPSRRKVNTPITFGTLRGTTETISHGWPEKIA